MVFAALCCKVEFHDYFRIFSDQLLKNCQEFLADLKILTSKFFQELFLDGRFLGQGHSWQDLFEDFLVELGLFLALAE